MMDKKPSTEETDDIYPDIENDVDVNENLDGGRGWVVCFGAFLVNFILDGTLFSFGILLIDLLDYFEETKSKTAWVGSTQLGMCMFMGPVVSLLLERYSCRQVTIAGIVIAFLAFIASIFSPNIEVLIITYGVIGGIGFCMAFISSIIVVGLYFNRKRALATGIASSGSGLGTFVYAYLTNELLQVFDWKGTVLILSGILLNCVLCGALFRPLPQTRQSRRGRKWEKQSLNAREDETDMMMTLSPPLNNSGLNMVKNYNINRLKRSMEYRLTRSSELSPRHFEESNKKSCNSYLDIRNDHHDVIRENRHSLTTNPMVRKDIFYSWSLQSLSEYKDASDLNSFIRSMKRDCSEMESRVFVSTSLKNNRILLKFSSIFGQTFDLFYNKVFLLLLLANVMWTVQSVPITYVLDLAVSKGLLKSQAALLISIIGIANILGRIFSGIMTDLCHLKSIVTYTCALLTASVVSFIMPFCTSFSYFAACCAVFGLCMATAVSMRTIVLADHLGIHKLTQSFGIVALFQGVAFMTNAPVAGFLLDALGSYLYPFIMAGTMYLVSGVACFVVFVIAGGHKPKNQSENAAVTVSVSSTERNTSVCGESSTDL
ncbi:hypothetical protein CHS0354_004024 [Potamilus streckersoni]|uniref:Major facilitator superfamily (MFS) profile domain-containing protein n=1 Tax=Potamilus streckersoni TaxID=2493646 RepID=A0AAE0VM76_9BIVA|nr:hypothetical protein CHS0354_004024 [Potamilus streckersoni]